MDKSVEAFSAYQKLRAEAERQTREAMSNWAARYAPDEMTMADLRNITATAVASVNHHTRQVYDMMIAREGGDT